MQTTTAAYTDSEMDRLMSMFASIVPDCIPLAQLQAFQAVIEQKIKELEARMKGFE